jgi:DNA-binding MarR family transcriptional regulator
MNRKEEYRKLFDLWTKIMAMMQEHESWVRDFGTGDLLHPSEIHTLQAVGDQDEINITSLAERLGITKSGVSQMANKLEKKGLIEKCRKSGNEKEVLLKMTEKGNVAYMGHELYHRRIQEMIDAELDNYDDAEIALMVRFLSRIRELIEMIVSEQTETKRRDAHE